jgi:hypothetical protein
MVTYYDPSQSPEQSFTVASVSECTAGQTLCQNNISYVCSGGSWVEGGSACQSSGCTSGTTKCEGGYWWTCEGGVWTLTNIPCNQTPTKNYMPYLILGGIGVMAIAGIALIARRP